MLQILEIKKKLRDVKNGSEYIGKKGNPIYNDFKKSTPVFLKNQSNVLTLKLSAVQFEYYTTLRCI